MKSYPAAEQTFLKPVVETEESTKTFRVFGKSRNEARHNVFPDSTV